jgi:hypothetical protein
VGKLLFFEVSSATVTQFFLNLLAVAGGFLAGYVLGWILCLAFDKWVLGKKSPQGLHRAVQAIMGLIVALLVALMVFGSGTGGGGGTGNGQGPGNQTGSPGTNPNPTTPASTATLPTPPMKEPNPSEVVKIVLLGGEDVKDERFYQLEGQKSALTFAELKGLIQDRKAASTKGLTLEIRFQAKNMLSRDHVAVRRLQTWATSEAALNVTFPGMPDR